MKKHRLALILTTAVILLSFLLAGCAAGGGGIPPEQYQQVSSQLQEAQAKIGQLQKDAGDMQAQKQAAEAAFKEAQAQVAQLQGQVGGLKEQFELTGSTPAETAEKIVRYYHETHIYSEYDLFVCSDMASEVWNMLKAQGINALVAIGDVDAPVTDIVLCNHAWVLAEVTPGQHLALETTAGYAVPQSQNVLYYRGWYFNSPKDLKRHNDLVREYNVRIAIHNEIVAKDKEVVAEYNQATNQTTADKLKAVHDKLVELIQAQEAELNKIHAEIDGLATPL